MASFLRLLYKPIKKEKKKDCYIRLAMLYGIECQTIKKQLVYQVSIAKVRILRWISGNARKDGY